MRFWGRHFAVLATAVLLCALIGCGGGGVENSPEAQAGENEPQMAETSKSGGEAAENQGEHAVSGAEDLYKAILENRDFFVSPENDNEKLNLETIGKAVTDDESVTVKATQFALVDLDSDGEKEVVLLIQINGVSDYGFEILKVQAGTVYGYTLPYRSFMSLKTDGTFTFSGGAADSGVGKIIFWEGGYDIDKLCYSVSQYNSANALEVKFYADGAECSEEEYHSILAEQEEKPDATWYELTLDNINAVL